MSEATLREGYRRLGLAETPEEISKLLILLEFLKFYGTAINLTASVDDESLVEHVLEALQVVALARQLEITGPWLDVGSGGGFPGLVLAACLDVELTLVEPRAKRASVLELGLGKLRRRNARVLRGRIEQGNWKGVEGPRLQPGFAAASARAVFGPAEWMAEAKPWLAPGGIVVVHVGVGETVAGEIVGRVDGVRWGAVAVRV